jgi:hypothetical protein
VMQLSIQYLVICAEGKNPTKRPASKCPASKGPGTKGPATKDPRYERSGDERSLVLKVRQKIRHEYFDTKRPIYFIFETGQGLPSTTSQGDTLVKKNVLEIYLCF